ncbi:MAG: flavohemoglobin expression-modulating QEGLA motif protein [Pseudomonadales bacterium]
MLIESIGTPKVAEHSRALYGAPTDPISSGHVNSLEAAQHFLEVSQQYRQATGLRDSDYCLSAEMLAAEMTPLLDEVFEPGLVRVEIDPDMASKAAAGATRIRLRAGTCFSEYDLGQLLQHEGFVHSLTAINGNRQTKIRSLGLGSPRTTGAQEGLATFAELVTGVMDINRLERLALRVIGIDHALNGADFIDVFRFFIDSGQSELESFTSSMRIFRGVPVTGGFAFSKDVVYLHGLMEVHTFFRWAMQHRKLDMCRHFFAGRMTVGDVVRMEKLFVEGVLDAPEFLPPWMVKTNGLAGYLAFSVFANRITIEELDEHHAFETPASTLALASTKPLFH